jgi:hypothetical protein
VEEQEEGGGNDDKNKVIFLLCVQGLKFLLKPHTTNQRPENRGQKPQYHLPEKSACLAIDHNLTGPLS